MILSQLYSKIIKLETVPSMQDLHETENYSDHILLIRFSYSKKEGVVIQLAQNTVKCLGGITHEM